MKEIKLEQFSGPLDLLIALIDQEKLNINDIALSKVTGQYFDYLNKLEERRPEELADFLVIATKLVYMKSKNLLPQISPDEDYGPSLAEQLKMYKRYIEASRDVNRMWNKSILGYGRVEPPVKPEGFVLPLNAKNSDLKDSFISLLKRLKPINPLPKVSIDRAISVKQKIDLIYNLLKRYKKISFATILAEAENKTEVIVSFLAILELIKFGNAAVRQTKTFADLEISKI
ncbi:MAG: segregation/condensation protein A [Candidatus Magasanikbacteria bacterium]|nr:segregation/condensation protein A [Candidatus Magasanikbacteria bacterium]